MSSQPAQQAQPDDISPELELLLQTDTSKGLTDAEVESRLAQFGPNGTCN